MVEQETSQKTAHLGEYVTATPYACVIRMRYVFAIRLSEAERRQVAGGAVRSGKSVSAFVREAALQASASVTRKVAEPEERDELPNIVVEPVRHMVDGEWVDSYR